METNELSKNAMGGTELMLKGLHDRVNPNLLEKVQVIPSRVREIDPDRKTVLWLHDLPGDPEVQHLKDGGWENYDLLVFVSYWQQQMYNLYLGVPFSAGVVLRNAIEPIDMRVQSTDKIRLIYTSTPHRGLEILYPVFRKLTETYDNIELDVYSSFSLYGWKERDQPFEPLFEALRQDPKVNYHGSVSNEEIREAVSNAHILAYPSIWQETSCLCLIEAMSSGCLAVHSSLAALPETSMGFTSMYGYVENVNLHANRFYSHLAAGIDLWMNRGDALMSSQTQKKPFVDALYGWEQRVPQWENVLRSISK